MGRKQQNLHATYSARVYICVNGMDIRYIKGYPHPKPSSWVDYENPIDLIRMALAYAAEHHEANPDSSVRVNVLLYYIKPIPGTHARHTVKFGQAVYARYASAPEWRPA